ncbi:excisionase family DNA-binding protein [Chitinophaga sp. Hz27]|uniref:excisionase family DNA-binding protein n=1 Tax=Chitinophaga sp. Hz27 TaxID=3347169 RepID=UPI0035E2DDC2
MNTILTIQMTPDDLRKLIANEIAVALQAAMDSVKRPSEYEEITVDQAAKEFNCSKRTIRRRMKELNIKGLRIGRSLLIQRKDLSKIKKAS